MFGLLGKAAGLPGLLGAEGLAGLLGGRGQNAGGMLPQTPSEGIAGLLGPITRGAPRAPVQIEGMLPAADRAPTGISAQPGFMQRAGDWMGKPVGPNGMTRGDAIYMLGAGLQDMSPNSRGGNLDAARGMFAQRDQQQRVEADRQARAKAAAAAMTGGKFDPQAYLSALGENVSLEDITAAERFGPDFSFHTAGGGDIVRTDGRTGEVRVAYDYNDPNAPLETQLLQAQIDATKALGNQRGQQGAYYAAKADQPYAPPRASTGGAPRTTAGAVRVSSPQQLAALPSGALFVGPDGVTRRKS